MSEKILCVTPNVALDRTLLVPDFEIGKILRIDKGIAVPGGKGLNVLRAIKIMGGNPVAMGLLGGYTGQMIAETVKQDGYEASWTWYEGVTRTCTILISADGAATVINESGRIKPEDWTSLVDDICTAAEDANIICVSGSIPNGAPDYAPSDLIESLNRQNKQVWIDSSGHVLENAIEARPYAIKVNGDEIGAVLEQTVDDFPSAVQAGRYLITMDIQIVVITLGKQGAVLISKDFAMMAHAPKIKLVDPIGSGDSVLAGIVQWLAAGHSLPDALKAGVAAGTANALFAGGAQFTRDSFDSILAQVSIEHF